MKPDILEAVNLFKSLEEQIDAIEKSLKGEARDFYKIVVDIDLMSIERIGELKQLLKYFPNLKGPLEKALIKQHRGHSVRILEL